MKAVTNNEIKRNGRVYTRVQELNANDSEGIQACKESTKKMFPHASIITVKKKGVIAVYCDMFY